MADKKQDFEVFDYGHLTQACNVCGERKVIQEDVNGGLSFYLPATDKHEFALSCDKCGSTLKYFIHVLRE